jgi:hypothetical protein
MEAYVDLLASLGWLPPERIDVASRRVPNGSAGYWPDRLALVQCALVCVCAFVCVCM